MRPLLFITIICLLSFCHGQKYDTSDAMTLSASPERSLSCGGCNININQFELSWHDQAYTHLAATIFKFVNKANNVTLTSTIQASSFTLPPSAAYAAIIVPDSVITTTVGGVVYTLSYPTNYRGIGGIERYSQTPIINANSTVKCVVSKTALTNAFFLHEDISNGLELSAFVNQPNNRECSIAMSSPPQTLVRVSSLTTTTTSYFDSPESRTSSAKEASPSNSLSPPTAPRTESPELGNRPTTAVLAIPSPRKTADVPLMSPTSAPTEPIKSDLIRSLPSAPTLLIASKNPEAETLSSPVILPPDQLQESSNGNSASRPGEPTPTAPVSPVSPTRPRPQVFGIAEIISLSTGSSLLVGSSRPSAKFVGITETVSLSPDASLTIELSRPSPKVVGITETVSLSPDASLTIELSRPSPQNFAITKTVASSPDSSPKIGSDSIMNPSDSFSTSNPTFSRQNSRPVTTPTSLSLPVIVNNPRPTSLSLLHSILTFTNRKSSSVANPSELFLDGTAEIHRGGSTIITSGTRSISLGKSATVMVDESSTIPLAIYIGAPLSQFSGLQGTAKPTSALVPPSVTTAAGNSPESFVGAQVKTAEVPMFMMLGAIFFGIAVLWEIYCV